MIMRAVAASPHRLLRGPWFPIVGSGHGAAARWVPWSLPSVMREASTDTVLRGRQAVRAGTLAPPAGGVPGVLCRANGDCEAYAKIGRLNRDAASPVGVKKSARLLGT